MKRSIFVVAGLLAASITMAADKPVKVNGVEIPPQQIEELVKNVVAQGGKDSPELRDHIKDSLAYGLIVEQEGHKRGYDKQAEFNLRVQEARQKIILGMIQRDWEKQNPVSAAEVKAEYDKQSKANTGNEYELAHIMLKTEADAKAVIDQLNKGGSFADLAKTKSQDSGSANNQGALGWLNPAQLPPALTSAVESLGKGQYSKTPVQSPSGWHVFRVTGIRPIKVPPFDQVKSQLENNIKNQHFETYMKQLHDKAKIE